MKNYNSLFDPHLADYFSSPIVRENLRRAGFITKHGKIILQKRNANCHGYKLKRNSSDDLVNYGVSFDTRDLSQMRGSIDQDIYLPHMKHQTLIRTLSSVNKSIDRKLQSKTKDKSFNRQVNSFTNIPNTWAKSQSFCELKFKYFGMEKKSTNTVNRTQFISIYQQHCGGNTLTIYKDWLTPGQIFTFRSRRNFQYPLGITIELDQIVVCRLSGCCEHKYKPGTLIGGRIFKIISIKDGLPCLSCQIRLKNQEESFSSRYSDQIKGTKKFFRLFACEGTTHLAPKNLSSKGSETSSQTSFVRANSITDLGLDNNSLNGDSEKMEFINIFTKNHKSGSESTYFRETQSRDSKSVTPSARKTKLKMEDHKSQIPEDSQSQANLPADFPTQKDKAEVKSGSNGIKDSGGQCSNGWLSREKLGAAKRSDSNKRDLDVLTPKGYPKLLKKSRGRETSLTPKREQVLYKMELPVQHESRKISDLRSVRNKSAFPYEKIKSARSQSISQLKKQTSMNQVHGKPSQDLPTKELDNRQSCTDTSVDIHTVGKLSQSSIFDFKDEFELEKVTEVQTTNENQRGGWDWKTDTEKDFEEVHRESDPLIGATPAEVYRRDREYDVPVTDAWKTDKMGTLQRGRSFELDEREHSGNVENPENETKSLEKPSINENLGKTECFAEHENEDFRENSSEQLIPENIVKREDSRMLMKIEKIKNEDFFENMENYKDMKESLLNEENCEEGNLVKESVLKGLKNEDNVQSKGNYQNEEVKESREEVEERRENYQKEEVKEIKESIRSVEESKASYCKEDVEEGKGSVGSAEEQPKNYQKEEFDDRKRSIDDTEESKTKYPNEDVGEGKNSNEDVEGKIEISQWEDVGERKASVGRAEEQHKIYWNEKFDQRKRSIDDAEESTTKYQNEDVGEGKNSNEDVEGKIEIHQCEDVGERKNLNEDVETKIEIPQWEDVGERKTSVGSAEEQPKNYQKDEFDERKRSFGDVEESKTEYPNEDAEDHHKTYQIEEFDERRRSIDYVEESKEIYQITEAAEGKISNEDFEGGINYPQNEDVGERNGSIKDAERSLETYQNQELEGKNILKVEETLNYQTENLMPRAKSPADLEITLNDEFNLSVHESEDSNTDSHVAQLLEDSEEGVMI